MDQYQRLMESHSTSAASKENPQECYNYFEQKWRHGDEVFQALEVPDYLLTHDTKQIFTKPVMLNCGCVLEQFKAEEWAASVRDNRTKDSPCPISSACTNANPDTLILDLMLQAACEEFLLKHEWAYEYNCPPGSGIS